MFNEFDKLTSDINEGLELVRQRRAKEALAANAQADQSARERRVAQRCAETMAKSAAASVEMDRLINTLGASTEKMNRIVEARRQAEAKREAARKAAVREFEAAAAQREATRKRASDLADKALADRGAGRITSAERDRIIQLGQAIEDATRAQDRAAVASAAIDAGADAHAAERLREEIRSAGLVYVAAMKAAKRIAESGR